MPWYALFRYTSLLDDLGQHQASMDNHQQTFNTHSLGLKVIGNIFQFSRLRSTALSHIHCLITHPLPYHTSWANFKGSRPMRTDSLLVPWILRCPRISFIGLKIFAIRDISIYALKPSEGQIVWIGRDFCIR